MPSPGVLILFVLFALACLVLGYLLGFDDGHGDGLLEREAEEDLWLGEEPKPEWPDITKRSA